MPLDPERLQEDVSKLLQVQAAQGQMLATINTQLGQNNAIVSQQAAQINALITSVEVIKSENITNRVDVTTKLAQIFAWQAASIDLFIPRKEHDAINLKG